MSILYDCAKQELGTRGGEKDECSRNTIHVEVGHISWTMKRTNAHVLEKLQVQRELLKDIEIKETTYFRHILKGKKA